MDVNHESLQLVQPPADKFAFLTLGGSTRFKDQYTKADQILSALGWMVLSASYCKEDIAPHYVPTEKEIEGLKVLHFAKIAVSRLYVVCHSDNYIGNSTTAEIAYADSKGIPVVWFDGTEFVMGNPGQTQHDFNLENMPAPEDHEISFEDLIDIFMVY